MLLPLPRATASVELVGSRSISSVAAVAEHHAAVLEKGRSRRAPLPQSWTGSGWGGGEEMWRRAGEVSALAGDVEEGEEMGWKHSPEMCAAAAPHTGGRTGKEQFRVR